MINLIKKRFWMYTMHFVLWPDTLDFMKDFVGKSIVIIMKLSHGRNIASTNTYSKKVLYTYLTLVFIPAWCKEFINMPKNWNRKRKWFMKHFFGDHENSISSLFVSRSAHRTPKLTQFYGSRISISWI